MESLQRSSHNVTCETMQSRAARPPILMLLISSDQVHRQIPAFHVDSEHKETIAVAKCLPRRGLRERDEYWMLSWKPPRKICERVLRKKWSSEMNTKLFILPASRLRQRRKEPMLEKASKVQ